MNKSVRLEILIIGAGLGGLSAAIACAMAGHKITVLERTVELAEIGAGLQLSPNSSCILQEYDLGPGLEECWAEPLSYTILRYSDGKVLHESTNWNLKMRERYGSPFVDVHRGQLQLLLFRRAVALGVTIKLGETVKSVDPETTEVLVQSGRIYRGDLLVGADGLWSVCRESLLGQESLPQPTGDLAYRIVLRLDQIRNTELQNMVREPACRLWIGPNSHVVAYSLKGGQQFNIVLLVPDDLPPDVAKQAGDIDEMRALFRSWDPILTRFLDCVDEVQKWKLMHLPELKTWRNNQGNFILIGDSCHPMLPYLAQGASSAIEDGAVLGKLLEKITSCAQLPQATAVWQQLRKNRSEFLVKQSSAQRDEFHLPDGARQRKRDLVFETYLHKEPIEGFPSRWADPKIQAYIFGYRAFEEAEAAATKLLERISDVN